MQVTPSLLGLFFSGILTFVAVIYFLMNYTKFNPYQTSIALFILSIAITAHAILHYFQEQKGFNPIRFL